MFIVCFEPMDKFASKDSYACLHIEPDLTSDDNESMVTRLVLGFLFIDSELWKPPFLNIGCLDLL